MLGGESLVKQHMGLHIEIEGAWQLTGPKDLESKLEARLSPSTQQCPSGTLTTSSIWEIPTQSPGNPTIRFMCLSL